MLTLVSRSLCVKARTSGGCRNLAWCFRRNFGAGSVKQVRRIQPQSKTFPCRIAFFGTDNRLHAVGEFADDGSPGDDESLLPPTLLSSLDSETKAELVGETTIRKLRMRSIHTETAQLNRRGFPLPESLSRDQWERLMGFADREFRLRYLDSISEGKEEEMYEELRNKDDLAGKGFKFTVDMFKDIDHRMSVESLNESVLKMNYVYEDLWQRGEVLPLTLDSRRLREALFNNNTYHFEKFLIYLGGIRSAKLNLLIKKRIRQSEGKKGKAQLREDRQSNDHIVYGLGFNTIRIRCRDVTIDNFDSWNVTREFHSWGQPLVLDLSFLSDMTFKQAKSIAYRELAFSLKHNRKSREPFALYMCNYNPKCTKMQVINKALPNLMDPVYSALCTEKSYLDSFDKERLVYLTADSHNDLTDIGPDDVFIVGALHDGGSGNPTTLMKAKKDGIRHARLPMKNTIGMTVDLNVDHVMAIMNDYKIYRDWLFSFRWVPARFFRNRVLVCGNSPRHEAIYKAHHRLSPHSDESLTKLTPQEYRRRYQEILEETLPAPKVNRRLWSDDGDNHDYRPRGKDRAKKKVHLRDLL